MCVCVCVCVCYILCYILCLLLTPTSLVVLQISNKKSNKKIRALENNGISFYLFILLQPILSNLYSKYCPANVLTRKCDINLLK